MSRKSKRQRKKEARQNAAVVGPGMVAAQFGRWTVLESHRTPEEQAALNAATEKFRQNFPDYIGAKVAELEALLAKHDSFDVLANLMWMELSIDPEKYNEPAHRHQDALVEYAALLCLKNAFSLARGCVNG